VQVDAGTALAVIEPLRVGHASGDGPRLEFGSLAGAGADASQPRSALAWLRRFALGFDVDVAETESLVAAAHRRQDVAGDDGDVRALEDELLHIFVDICALFRARAEEDGAHPEETRTPEEYFLLFLRSLDTATAGVSSRFVESLRRALGHYGIENLRRTAALEETLLWICRGHERIHTQAKIARGILERRLTPCGELWSRDDDPFGALLERIIFSTRRRYPELGDLAREVLYRNYYRPFYSGIWQQAYVEVDQDLEVLLAAGDVAARGDAMHRLIQCAQPLAGFFSGRFPGAEARMRELMLEVMVRRHYRERSLGDFSSATLDDVSSTRTQYCHDGRTIHLLCCFSPLPRLDRTLGTLKSLVADIPAEQDVVIDCYLSDAPRESDEDDLAQRLSALIDGAGFGRSIRRIVMVMALPEASLGGGAGRYFTFRCPVGRVREDRICRGLHPMMGKRLELWRLQEFDVERLPSSDSVYLFRGTAKSNPRDERLFAFAEIRDLTPIREEHGRIPRLPHLEMMVAETLDAIRLYQSHLPARGRLHWNQIFLYVWPPIEVGQDVMNTSSHRFGLVSEGLGLEKLVARAQMRNAAGELRDVVIEVLLPGGREVILNYSEPPCEPVKPMAEYDRKVVRMRQLGLLYPYEIIRALVARNTNTDSSLPSGSFQEYDLDQAGSLVAVNREHGRNSAGIIVGCIAHHTSKHPEGMRRVFVIGDPSLGMGTLAEAECRRIIAALELAERESLPLEWYALSSGALIAMDSGTESLDWIALVLRRIIEFTQRGGEINIVVWGVNVGGQSYWNAEATMLMHTRGILIMTADGSMLLTGKRALDYSGGVSAQDNQGIGGYDKVMGVNGQAQYWASDVWEAARILMRYYEHTYVPPGERFPRRAASDDPPGRDISSCPHGHADAYGVETVGDILSDETNPGRHKPFDIRKVMAAVIDQDLRPLERWHDMREAETAVIWDAHIGGYPLCLVGIQSHPVQRLGFVPMDGPEQWTAATLFPLSSKKVARAINAASGNRPLVVLANLSGFDGSPESMRRLQLEYGAEIGRAVVNFRGPMVFCGICRYHGGAYVVFSRTLNECLEVAALDGSYASVIGGKPAAAVVFASDVARRTLEDPRLQELNHAMRTADESTRSRLHVRWHELHDAIHAEKFGEIAEQFDSVHTVQRAKQVGSLHHIVQPAQLRPYLIGAVERGIRRELERMNRQ
jgi:acetyl-CoA carboxylase carboxyltransferase component